MELSPPGFSSNSSLPDFHGTLPSRIFMEPSPPGFSTRSQPEYGLFRNFYCSVSVHSHLFCKVTAFYGPVKLSTCLFFFELKKRWGELNSKKNL